MDAATKAASRLERPKNLGRSSAAFSGVMTFASSMNPSTSLLGRHRT
jgi:hypothetical protein